MKVLKQHRKKIAFIGAMFLLLIFTYFCMGNNSAEKTAEKDISYNSTENSDLAEEEFTVIDDASRKETESEEMILSSPEDENVVPADDEILTCTITIRCDTILNNIDLLEEAKHPLIPPNGIILAKREVTFNEGESVFDVLLRETHNNKIHMEFVKSPVYDSAYIEGIHNLYEFDCGELSGWMYSVNGWFPNYGCSNYILKDGDSIEWVYTCNLGKDVQ